VNQRAVSVQQPRDALRTYCNTLAYGGENVGSRSGNRGPLSVRRGLGLVFLAHPQRPLVVEHYIHTLCTRIHRQKVDRRRPRDEAVFRFRSLCSAPIHTPRCRHRHQRKTRRHQSFDAFCI
jgi:hypothetical protein